MSNTAYLERDDYTISTSLENLNEIVAQAAELSGLTEDQILDNSELTAQAEIRSYLAAVYDIDSEFALNAADEDEGIPATIRNKLTLRCNVNLSLFNLHMTISPRDVPEKVEKAYERCLEMLDAARRGELDFGLDPATPADDGTVAWRTIGSNEKFTSKEFLEGRIFDTD